MNIGRPSGGFEDLFGARLRKVTVRLRWMRSIGSWRGASRRAGLMPRVQGRCQYTLGGPGGAAADLNGGMMTAIGEGTIGGIAAMPCRVRRTGR